MAMAMRMTIDQKLQFLHASFVELDPETLFMVLQANDYAMTTTLETLFEMDGMTMQPPATLERPPPPPLPPPTPPLTHVPSVPTPHSQPHSLPHSQSLSQSQSQPHSQSQSQSQPHSLTHSQPHSQSVSQPSKRGAHVTLPPDFLRLPRPHSHSHSSTSSSASSYSSSSRLAAGSQDYLSLFADPEFLAEMEREFGPDFESVLREHMQAEALRNTAPYSSYQTGHHEAPLPSTTMTTSQPPMPNTYQSTTTPVSNDYPQVSSRPMAGFGGGEDAPSSSSSSISISDRFHGILNKFMPQTTGAAKRTNKGESSGLLASNYEEESDEGESMGEEDAFLGQDGVEMQTTGAKQQNDDEGSDDEEGTASLLR